MPQFKILNWVVNFIRHFISSILFSTKSLKKICHFIIDADSSFRGATGGSGLRVKGALAPVESCVNNICSMGSSSFERFWLITFWACLIQPLDSATNTTMGKSKELSIDLNKSGKSLWAISKQLQVPRSTVQTTVCMNGSPSPDLNLIENMWTVQKKEVCARKPTHWT